MPCGIYKIINLINNHFYIGSSKNTVVRFYRHRIDLKNNCHDNSYLQNAWNLYGEQNFMFVLEKECNPSDLFEEEQKILNECYGKTFCYNLSPSAARPNLGVPRSESTKKKISDAQRGKPKFSNEQKMRMSIRRKGKKHSEATREKMRNRESSKKNISLAHQANTGRIYSEQHKINISNGKLKSNKKLTEEQRKNVSNGVAKAVLEGRYKKNKIPESERENIKSIYLSKMMNKRQLAFKYGVLPTSMGKYLKKMGL